ncbi:unnamed protein product [Candidula unifasciata]|uniref:Uncharacterized protein n=1 Tax=Candidula unifasciata TaxID=100452 RepID=A0A8S3ZJG8_9EUPU|nr:unnamed protein product [Candidula unifasciata]
MSRRGSCHKTALNSSTCLLPVVNVSSPSNSSSNTDIYSSFKVDDDGFLFTTHPDNSTNRARLHTQCQLEDLRSIIPDRHKPATPVFHATLYNAYVNFEVQTGNEQDDLSCSLKTGDSLSNTNTQRDSENPQSFPVLAQNISFAEEKLPNFNTVRNRPQSLSALALRGHVSDCLESFSNIRYSGINKSGAFSKNQVSKDDDHSCLTSRRLLCELSSGDSANISESESKMGDFPPFNGPPSEPEDQGGPLATSSEGEGEPLTLEVKDIGYSSDSLSNDEDDVLHHQIGIECKFPGKCEVASDGPLGEKITLPSVATRPEYYFMTLVDIDSTDKTDNGDTTDSGGEKMKKYRGQHKIKSAKDDPELELPYLNLPRSSADNLDSTDSGGEKMDKYTSQFKMKSTKNVPKLEGQNLLLPRSSSHQAMGITDEDECKETGNCPHTLDDSQNILDPTSISVSDRYFKQTKSSNQNTYEFLLENECISPVYDYPPENECISPASGFSESNNVVESKEKNSIKYLIEHAEDLVKYSSPHKQTPKSPSKQTQTDSFSTVESSCDASAEDNSEFESHLESDLVKEDLSTATDDADETLFNSVINIDSVDDSMRSEDLDHTIISSPYSPVIVDSPHLRKQTCRRRNQKGDSRPWSVVGLDGIILSKKFPNQGHSISAVSESAINCLPFQTDSDLPSWLRVSSQSMPSCNNSHRRRIHRASTSCDQISSQLEYSEFHSPQTSCTETTFSTSYQENTLNSHSSLTTQTRPVLNIPLAYASVPSQTALNQTSSRHSPRKACSEKHKTRHSSGMRSWGSDVFDSAELEPGMEISG